MGKGKRVALTAMVSEPNASYKKLETLFERYYYLRSTASMLRWDAATQMPLKSAQARAGQLAALEQSMGELLTADSTRRFLRRAKAEEEGLSSWQRANLREMHRLCSLHSAIPQRLTTALQATVVPAEVSWREARSRRSFEKLRQPLEKVVELVREKAKRLGDTFSVDPYTGLIQEHDPGGSVTATDAVFNVLADRLPALTAKIIAAQSDGLSAAPSSATKRKSGRSSTAATDANSSSFSLDTAVQRKLCRALLDDLGFDFGRGRLDASDHPFTEGTRGDIRITVRYHQHQPLDALFAAMHECGHALYDMHLPGGWHTQPVGYDRGMLMHEGVALFYEMCLGRSKSFARYLSELAGRYGVEWSESFLCRQLLRIEPGCIRVDADEVSYIPHIILRYHIEQELISGELPVAAIPERWNELMQRWLGILPRHHAEGCLQDVHWAAGLFGYFPSYALGAVFSAGLSTQLQEHLAIVNRDSLLNLKERMAEVVFALGSRYELNETLDHVLNRAYNPEEYLRYLEQKYLR